jgi:predicted Zn-dependent peptidase
MSKVTEFSGGLKLVHNLMTGTRSASIGVFVRAGSSNETAEQGGISHFIEHMMFKGTPTRSAFDIAEELESLGIDINAFTSREMTAYYAVAVDEHIEKSAEVLADIFFNSVFDKEEIEKEKGVVLEEIAKSEDDPADLCYDLLYSAYFGDTGLGRPILGTVETVNSFTQSDLFSFKNAHYLPKNTIISIAGNVSEQKALEIVKKLFEPNFKNTNAVQKAVKTEELYDIKSRTVARDKPIEQANIALGFPAYKYNDKMSIAAALVSSILGGGMSSRLFQEIRENLGIAYEVYSSITEYSPVGFFSIFVATNLKQVENAIKAVKDIVCAVKEKGITQKEFLKGKEQLKSGVVLGAERSYSVMRAAARALFAGEIFSVDKTLNKIKEVTIEDVQAAANYMLDAENMSVGYVGKSKKINIVELMKC